MAVRSNFGSSGREASSAGRRRSTSPLAGMMDKGFAEHFANEWIAAWNSHDLNRILAHYEDDFEMSSPVIMALAGEPSGKLRGKAAVGAYWTKALQSTPDLRFELVTALAGVDSVTVYYKGHRGLSAEVLHFSPDGKVRAAFAHYADAPSDALHSRSS
jgi:ketosteroid isomerase-like protein